MKKNIVFALFMSLLFQTIHAEEKSTIDHLLRKKIERHNIRALKTLSANSNRSLVELGRRLFSDVNLSGNRVMACQTCHNPATGTSDARPMSQTENGKGILQRNAPALFNLGQGEKGFMFWDGRVHYDFKKKIFITPEPAINGANPTAMNISSVMTSALSAQAIFPLVAQKEMMGEKGQNEIADAKNNLEAWERLVARLKPAYRTLLQKAYPDTPLDKINIGHIGESIAAFEKEAFQATGSPLQRYLKGDNSAMTPDQKRGFFIFLGSGKCINCHQGSELGNNNLFASIGVPQWGEAPLKLDLGRGAVVKESARNFFFRVPGLLNVNLTAPYMHNGAFQTLREVINHYDHISGSLNDFEVSDRRQSTIPVNIEIDKNPKVLDDIWLSSQSGLSPVLKNRLMLTKPEKDFLEVFLKEALTSY